MHLASSFHMYFSPLQFGTMGSRKQQCLALAQRRKERSYRKVAIFSDTEAILYAANRDVKCLRSSVIESSQLPNKTSYVQCKCRAEEERLTMAIYIH